MANVLKVQEQDLITQLAAAGWPIRRIARQLDLDRKTVRRYLRGEGSQRTQAEASKSPTISTPGSTELLESKSPISTAGSDGAGEAAAIALLETKPPGPVVRASQRRLMEILDGATARARTLWHLPASASPETLSANPAHGTRTP